MDKNLYEKMKPTLTRKYWIIVFILTTVIMGALRKPEDAIPPFTSALILANIIYFTARLFLNLIRRICYRFTK